MERFAIAADLARTLPEMLIVVATARDLSNSGPQPGVDAYASSAASTALTILDSLPNAQSHPRVAHYRTTLKAAAGVAAKKFPQSNESLLKRLVKSRQPGRINPVVDFYNAVSVRHGVTAGAFDMQDLGSLGKGSAVELRFSRGGDSFRALDAGDDADAVAVPAGELSYCIGDVVLTRQLAWRQSIQGLVTEETSQVVLMSEVFDEGGKTAEAAEAVRHEFEQGLKDLFGAQSSTFVLGQSTGRLEAML